MTWKEAIDVRSAACEDWLFDELDRAAEPLPAQMIASPMRYEDEFRAAWRFPIAMLVTRERVFIARSNKGVFRKSAAETKWWWCDDFLRYGVGDWRGAGPHYEVRLDHAQEGRIVFVFRTLPEAEAIGKRIAFDNE